MFQQFKSSVLNSGTSGDLVIDIVDLIEQTFIGGDVFDKGFEY